MSIRLRLALLVALISCVFVAVGGVVCIGVLSTGMRATLEDSLRRSATRLGSDVVAGRIDLASRIPVVEPLSDQSVVQVLSATGRVEFTTIHAGSAPLLGAAERVRAGRAPIFFERRSTHWRSPHLLIGEKLSSPDGPLLVVGASLDELDNATARLELLLGVGGAALVAAAGLGGFVLAGRALRPVERLRAEAASISATFPGRRLAAPKTHDELARLAKTLNELLERLHGALSRQQQFVAVASHELRTPLAVLRAELEIARRAKRSQAEVNASLDVSARRVEMLIRLADDLLVLARADQGALVLHQLPARLEPIVADSLVALSAVADRQGVTLVLDADPEVAAEVDAGRFQQVLDNLVANALDHALGARLVEVRIATEGTEAVVEVRDDGCGFAPSVLDRAFDRFTRGEATPRGGRRGAGLGLAIVRLIVEAHGGRVEARNGDSHGARGASVVISLRACAAPVEPPQPWERRVEEGDACASLSP